MSKLRVLDLFSGIGGFSLGLEMTGGFETVQFVEQDEKCQRVLRKHWPEVPIHGDIKTYEPSGTVDVVCGGFPCQPFSVAGQQRGAEDDRHLWPEMCRVIERSRPAWVVGENVAGIIRMELDQVLSDLEALEYACRAFVVPACAVDAPHRRDRVWIVGYADGHGKPTRAEHDEARGMQTLGHSNADRDGNRGQRGGVCDGNRNGAAKERGRVELVSGADASSQDVAHANSEGPQGRAKTGNAGGERQGRDEQFMRCRHGSGSAWKPEPRVGRVADGVPGRVDRLRQLGNAVVPQVVAQIGYAILAAHEPD